MYGARRRIRDWIRIPDTFVPGLRNAITDVPEVTVGHTTLTVDPDVRTGVTVIRPHGSDIFRYKCPAAVHVGNGFGKLSGLAQITELGELETIIALTNTLSVPQAMQGLLDYHLPLTDGSVTSINAVVGETNDGYLNDIRGCHVRPEHVVAAIHSASADVAEGCVGAGTGTCCFGFKGGIGTSSRAVADPAQGSDVMVGAIVQTNFGGRLNLYGHPLPSGDAAADVHGGSCMIVVATDAPLDSRQLGRLAARGIVGLTRAGSQLAHNSGDFCLAFSNREPRQRRDSSPPSGQPGWPDAGLSPLFDATIEAVTEAIYNSLCTATPTEGVHGHRVDIFRPEAHLRELPARLWQGP
jgi:D-aminopeptidase